MNSKKLLSNMIKIIGLTSTTLVAFNQFISYCSSKNNTLNSSEGTFFLWKHGKVFYTKTGNGKPLLLIHDLSHFASGREWSKVINELSNKHTVYVLDLLGCGCSDKPAVTYTNYLYVQMISDFIKEVICEPTNVVFSGEACPIAITMAKNDKSLLNKIVLVNPPSVSNSELIPNNNTIITKRIIETPIIGTFAYYVLNSKANCFEKSINEYFSKDDYTSYTYSHTMYDASHKNGCGSKYVMASIIGLYTNLSIRRPLISINNDIVIIGGTNEPNIEDNISSYKAIRPNVHSVIVENAKHFPHLENPSEFIVYLEKNLD